jgi:hypothetical protein
MEATATTTKKVISDKSAQAQKIMSRANKPDFKKLAGNDKDVPEVKPEVDNKAIESARVGLENAKKIYEEAKAHYHKLTGKTTKSSEPKGPGVISSIFDLVKSSKKGISKDEILTKLVEMFPDRAKEGMVKTIQVQLPKRMSTERKVTIIKSEDGKFSLK